MQVNVVFSRNVLIGVVYIHRIDVLLIEKNSWLSLQKNKAIRPVNRKGFQTIIPRSEMSRPNCNEPNNRGKIPIQFFCFSIYQTIFNK